MTKGHDNSFFKEFKLKTNQPLSEKDIPTLWLLFLVSMPFLSEGTTKHFRWIPYEGERDGSLNHNYFLGLCYMLGIGVEQSDNESFKYYKCAAEEGSAVAQNNVAYMYAEGVGVDPSPNDAYYYFQKSADQDQSVALFNLSRCFAKGFGVRVSKKKSIETLFKAHILGDSIATRALLDCIMQNSLRDIADNFDIWKQLADQGHPEVHLRIGEYFDRYGDEQSQKDAFFYLKYAADQGISSAQWKIASYFKEGKGTEKNLAEADRYHQMAIERGYTPSREEIREKEEKKLSRYMPELRRQFFLANCPNDPHEQYLIGVFLADHSEREGAFQQAFELFEKAAQRNYAPAQYRLAKCYLEGKGIEQSDTSGFLWLKKAADAGCTGALLDVGFCYHEGKGVQQSDSEAYRYWKLAADKGSPDGAWRVACSYFYGKGVEQSDTRAFFYAQLAAEKGSVAGLQSVGCCYMNAIGTDKDEKKAFECFKRAALKGDRLAEYRIGICYEKGLGIEKNEMEAFRHFKAAADKKLDKALSKLHEQSKRRVA